VLLARRTLVGAFAGVCGCGQKRTHAIGDALGRTRSLVALYMLKLGELAVAQAALLKGHDVGVRSELSEKSRPSGVAGSAGDLNAGKLRP
jgi:hypothetical protein